MEIKETLVRAARELLEWDQELLAKKAKIGVATLRRFETGTEISQSKVDAIRTALQKAGVAFLGPGQPPAEVLEGVALTVSRKPRRRRRKSVIVLKGDGTAARGKKPLRENTIDQKS